MQDNWWSHNTDKLILLFLVILLWTSTAVIAVHIFHHDVDSMEAIAFISFMTGSVSTVLGALVMIMTGRIQRADTPATPAAVPPTIPDAPSSSNDSGKLKVNVP